MEIAARSGGPHGFTLFKPAHIAESGALGVKIVSVFPSNAAKGLPTVPGTILVLNDTTGMLEGLVDGTYVTALRTAAGSGAATRKLANAAAKTCVVFGAGAQAASHIEAMLAVRDLQDITVISRSVANAEALIAGIRSNYADVVIWAAVASSDAATVEAAVRSADIVCTCTSSATPLFDGRWLKPGAHVNAVGSYQAHVAELDTTTVQRSVMILDSEAAVECGEVHMNVTAGSIAMDTHVLGTLGALLDGALPAERLAPTATQVS